jgi:hypothetical protein
VNLIGEDRRASALRIPLDVRQPALEHVEHHDDQSREAEARVRGSELRVIVVDLEPQHESEGREGSDGAENLQENVHREPPLVRLQMTRHEHSDCHADTEAESLQRLNS